MAVDFPALNYSPPESLVSDIPAALLSVSGELVLNLALAPS
jgi:hypothetical protein